MMPVGLLIPNSTIYPSLGRDFVQGIRLGFDGNELPLKMEGIGLGAKSSECETALQKLSIEHNINTSIAYTGNAVLPDLVAHFTDPKSLLIHTNLGGHLPCDIPDNRQVIHNAFDLWYNAWCLGRHMAKEGHKEVLYIGTYYEGGYQMPYALDQGLQEGGAAISAWHVPKPDAVNFDMDALRSKFREQPPQAVYLAFNKSDAKDFLSAYRDAGLDQLAPIYCAPMMLESEVMNDLQHLNFSCTTASSWFPSDDHPNNNAFRKAHTDAHGKAPNPFALMGYEAGLILKAAQALPDLSSLKEHIRELNGPRRNWHYNTTLQKTCALPHIYKASISNGHCEMTDLGPANEPESLPDKLFKTRSVVFTIWSNPYICI
ncbi:MAG: ABC transporter substrate-binding protein [Flavobacteriales bacterium]|nr:ABC transporter substrate-binding protein [Flavobacteriales bacterium]